MLAMRGTRSRLVDYALDSSKCDAFELKLTGDVRRDGAGLDGVHRATAIPDSSSAWGTMEPVA